MKTITTHTDGTVEEFDDGIEYIPSQSEMKAIGKPYELNGVTYQVPLDKDAQDAVVAVTVKNLAGAFVKTNIEFSNGVVMPITKDEFMPFALWFGAERGKFFE